MTSIDASTRLRDELTKNLVKELVRLVLSEEEEDEDDEAELVSYTATDIMGSDKQFHFSRPRDMLCKLYREDQLRLTRSSTNMRLRTPDAFLKIHCTREASPQEVREKFRKLAHLALKKIGLRGIYAAMNFPPELAVDQESTTATKNRLFALVGQKFGVNAQTHVRAVACRWKKDTTFRGFKIQVTGHPVIQPRGYFKNARTALVDALVHALDQPVQGTDPSDSNDAQ